jgi:hypothetical protein
MRVFSNVFISVSKSEREIDEEPTRSAIGAAPAQADARVVAPIAIATIRTDVDRKVRAPLARRSLRARRRRVTDERKNMRGEILPVAASRAAANAAQDHRASDR